MRYHNDISLYNLATNKLLLIQDEKHLCVGPEAQKVIGICDKRQIIRPDLSNTKWKYVFIQSNSRVRKLPKGSYFMFCKLSNFACLTITVKYFRWTNGRT